MIEHLYFYRATVIAVHDGDTVTLNLSLGFNFRIDGFKVRLLAINAPEVVGVNRAAGLASRDFLRERILGKTIMLHSYKDRADKYGGRWLGVLYDGDVNVNDLMVESGHATAYAE